MCSPEAPGPAYHFLSFCPTHLRCLHASLCTHRFAPAALRLPPSPRLCADKRKRRPHKSKELTEAFFFFFLLLYPSTPGTSTRLHNAIPGVRTHAWLQKGGMHRHTNTPCCLFPVDSNMLSACAQRQNKYRCTQARSLQ